MSHLMRHLIRVNFVCQNKMRLTFILPLVLIFLAVIIRGKQGIRTLSAALYSTRPRHRVGSVPSVKNLDFPKSALSLIV